MEQEIIDYLDGLIEHLKTEESIVHGIKEEVLNIIMSYDGSCEDDF